MGKVLELEQREQAGSGSYNRFEYQVHWIVCHIIGQLENNAECIVFCEFHDDMAEFYFISNNDYDKDVRLWQSYIEDGNVPTDTAHLIFQQLVNDVRKKSTEQIKTPISFKSLVDKKGIEISKINDKINSTISKKGNICQICFYCRKAD